MINQLGPETGEQLSLLNSDPEVRGTISAVHTPLWWSLSFFNLLSCIDKGFRLPSFLIFVEAIVSTVTGPLSF